MGNFNKMEVWVEAKALAVKIYQLTSKGKFTNDSSLLQVHL